MSPILDAAGPIGVARRSGKGSRILRDAVSFDDPCAHLTDPHGAVHRGPDTIVQWIHDDWAECNLSARTADPTLNGRP